MGLFALGFLSSLAAATLVAAIGVQIRRRLEQRGEVAGYWLQLTYEPGDEDRAEPIRSIELLELRNHKSGVTGTMWRLYCSEWERRWAFVGRSEDGVISGVYWATRDHRGGFGSVLMTEEERWLYAGEFFWTVYQHLEGGAVSVTRRSEPMEWIALQACHDVGLEKVITRYLDCGASEFMPLRCRAVLGIGKAHWRARIREALASASATFSPQHVGVLTHTRTMDEGRSDLTRSDLIT